jgi:hypothetical protein
LEQFSEHCANKTNAMGFNHQTSKNEIKNLGKILFYENKGSITYSFNQHKLTDFKNTAKAPSFSIIIIQKF